MRMGTVGNGELALTRAASELHGQAVAVELTSICGFSSLISALADEEVGR